MFKAGHGGFQGLVGLAIHAVLVGNMVEGSRHHPPQTHTTTTTTTTLDLCKILDIFLGWPVCATL